VLDAAPAELLDRDLSPATITSATSRARARLASAAEATVITYGRADAAVKNASSQSNSHRWETTAIGGTGTWPRSCRAAWTSSGSSAGP
jgi:hypothetical protein